MNHSRTKWTTGGFTLVEVMVTLVVIAILAAVAVPLYQNYSTRARVAEALVFADGARTRVDLPLMQGRTPQDLDKDLLAASGQRVDMVTRVDWVPATTPAGAPTSPTLGFILVQMKLPGLGEAPLNALALQRTAQGAWICTSAAKVSVPDPTVLPLDEKYLPASCHGDGSALAAPAGRCPSGQEMVTLSSAGQTHSACTPACGPGQTRDTSNPTQCNSPPPAANQNPVLPPVQPAVPATPSVAPTKPAASAPVAAASASKPVASGPPRQCHVCDPDAPPELCEKLTVETTCAYPTNYCMTEVNNHADGTKDVRRYCGSFDEMYREWWLGTSDDDKCRMDTPGVDARCTYGCEKPNCNSPGGSLIPPQESLYSDK